MDQVTLLDRAEKQSPIFAGSMDRTTREFHERERSKAWVLAGGGGGDGGEGVLRGCSPEPQAQTPGKL